MTQPARNRAASGAGLDLVALQPSRAVKWLIAIRLVAVSALLVGALLVQSTTEELLPIGPLVRVSGLTYVLSLAARRATGTLYAGTTAGGAFRSDDGGDTWRVMEDGLPVAEQGRRIPLGHRQADGLQDFFRIGVHQYVPALIDGLHPFGIGS